MDLLTHGLLGALCAQTVARREQARPAAVAGFFAALLPDADTLIRNNADPLLTLEYHRHFTHALLFAPIGALLATLLLLPLLGRIRLQPPFLGGPPPLPPTRLYVCALIAYTSALLLDLCTSYGIHLFWPLRSEPVALSIIAVVDPVFTTILALGVWGVWRGSNRHSNNSNNKRRFWLAATLGGAALYLAFGALQHQRALAAAEQLAHQRGPMPERLLVKPTLGNLLLWRSIAIVDAQVHVAAVRVGLNGSVTVYSGDSASLVHPQALYDPPPGSRAHEDLHRFYRFADRLLVRDSEDPRVLGDLRYAMLPTSAAPLWGIRLPEDPQQQPQWVTRRQMTPEMRQQFMTMLKGATLKGAQLKDAPLDTAAH